MNKAASWRETGFSELLMTKLDCVCDGHRFCLGINSSLVAIIVECSTGTETISSSAIPRFASAWLVVNNYRDSKGAKWCGIIIERSDIQVLPCWFAGISRDLAHEIECELRLFQKLTAQLFWEL